MTNAATGKTLNVFNPDTAEFFKSIRFEPGSISVEVGGHQVATAELVLLPSTELTDEGGADVCLADVLVRTVDGVEETYFVGLLPQRGELIERFKLCGYKRSSAAELTSIRRADLEASPDVVSTFKRIGNLYETPERFVPEDTFYCYHGLSWEGGMFRIITCPFFTPSDHGVTYCRYLQAGSLQNRADSMSKAVAHYGSADAVFEAAPYEVLWDQVKVCGISDDRDSPPDFPEEDDEELVQDEP